MDEPDNFIVPLLPYVPLPLLEGGRNFILARTSINGMSVLDYVKKLLDEKIIERVFTKEIGRNYVIVPYSFSEFIKPQIYYGELINIDNLKTPLGMFNLRNLHESYSLYKFLNKDETNSHIPAYQSTFKKYYNVPMYGGKSFRKHMSRRKVLNRKRKNTRHN